MYDTFARSHFTLSDIGMYLAPIESEKGIINIRNGNQRQQTGTDSEPTENYAGPFPIVQFPTDIWTYSLSYDKFHLTSGQS